jgi:hypothetical protein
VNTSFLSVGWRVEGRSTDYLIIFYLYYLHPVVILWQSTQQIFRNKQNQLFTLFLFNNCCMFPSIFRIILDNETTNTNYTKTNVHTIRCTLHTPTTKENSIMTSQTKNRITLHANTTRTRKRNSGPRQINTAYTTRKITMNFTS